MQWSLSPVKIRLQLKISLQTNKRHFSVHVSCALESYLSMALQVLLLDLGRFFNFLIIYTVGRTFWTGDQPVARPLPTHRTIQTQNKRTRTFMPWVGFELTIPAFGRAKTVHALDRAATVIGYFWRLRGQFLPILEPYTYRIQFWNICTSTVHLTSRPSRIWSSEECICNLFVLQIGVCLPLLFDEFSWLRRVFCGAGLLIHNGMWHLATS
jgi:hypothetical protein